MIMTLHLLILACWGIFMLYWFLSAGSVQPIQSSAGWLSGNWYTLLFLAGFAFIIGFRPLARRGIPVAALFSPVLLPSPVLDVACIVILVSGLVIAIAARHTLAGNWSSAVAIKQDHELVTSGLYSHVRNPIYTGVLLMALATVLSYGTLGALVGFLIIALVVYLKLSDEERILARHFGDAYALYKQHTKALIPFIW